MRLLTMPKRSGRQISPVLVILMLSACASTPVPQCIPPNLTRAPESVGPLGSVVPRPNDNAEEQYARCKEREADGLLEAELLKQEKEARQREAEQLERELREGPSPEDPQ